MVFKKKETPEQKKARLEAELAALNKPPEPPPPPPREEPTLVQEVKSDKEGPPAEFKQGFFQEVEAAYGQELPELGPSGHAHVERVLLLAILAELRMLRDAIQK